MHTRTLPEGRITQEKAKGKGEKGERLCISERLPLRALLLPTGTTEPSNRRDFKFKSGEDSGEDIRLTSINEWFLPAFSGLFQPNMVKGGVKTMTRLSANITVEI